MAITVEIDSVATDITVSSLNISDNINDRSSASFEIVTTGSVVVGSEVVNV